MTMDEIQKVTELTERCHKAEAERDSWRRVAERLEGEKQALAAQMTNSNSDKLCAANNIRQKATDDLHLQGVADMLERSAGENPATSLARQKLQWQAEALEKLADNFAEAYAGRIRHEAAELRRRQAEGGQDAPDR